MRKVVVKPLSTTKSVSKKAETKTNAPATANTIPRNTSLIGFGLPGVRVSSLGELVGGAHRTDGVPI
jgi:hypothetical protein